MGLRACPWRAATLAGLLAAAGCAGDSRPHAPGAAGTVTAWSALPPAGPLQVALLYHHLAGTPPPPELAFAWPDVCAVRGEAEQAVALRRAAPRLAEAVRAVDAAPSWRVQLRQELGAWDAAQGGFRTVLRNGAVVRFEPADFCFADLRYLLAFTDGDRFSLLPADAAAATRLAQADPSRAVVYDLEVRPSGHRLEGGVPLLLVSVVRLRALDARGAVVAERGPAGE